MSNLLDVLAQFFIVMISAMVAENAVFSRALSTPRQLVFVKDQRSIMIFGCAVTFMTTVSGVFSSLLNLLFRRFELTLQLRSIGFLACICGVYLATSLILAQKIPEQYTQIQSPLMVAAFNSAVFGSILLSAVQGYSFLNTFGYGLGTGVGLTLAMILVYVGRRNLEISDVPKAFKGLPITLVYIGILSLAIYGLIGHQLPS